VAPAKINLALRAGARRADGFHPLNTLFHAVDLMERVTVEPLAAGPDMVEVSGRDAGAVPLDGSNLALRAAALLRRVAADQAALAAPPAGPAPVSPVGAARISIEKAIPVAGGLAGGSADAAAVMVALNELWGLGLVRSRLVELAAELGSDVPFALVGENAIGRGRGERLEVLRGGGRLHWVLAVSSEGMSTPEVFREFDSPRRKRTNAPRSVPGRLLEGLRRGDPEMVGRNLVNDLQRSALELRPGLDGLLRRARSAGACGALVSGSGPTLALLATGPAAADALAERLAAENPTGVFLRAAGPAAGARLASADV
jgi:4-diphosphocytidyl-2-C-methyl-D-erythritol kinase